MELKIIRIIVGVGYLEIGAGDIGAITITVETGTAKESGTTVETRFVDTVWTPTLQVYSAETVLDVLPKLVNNMVRMNRSSKLQGELVEGWEMGNEDRCMFISSTTLRTLPLKTR